jgi:RNA polymerase sigma-70 factor (ECF subfamily)
LESIKELYETYEQYIFRYLYGLALNYHIAEELTQETFFQLIKSSHRFRGDCHVSTWIYRIARNVYSQYCKKRTVKTISIDETILDISDRDGPEIAFQRKENIKLIKNALLQIPEKQREILWLRDWQNLSYEEIATITDHSVSWVKVNIHRGRLAFKKVYCKGGVLSE